MWVTPRASSSVAVPVPVPRTGRRATSAGGVRGGWSLLNIGVGEGGVSCSGSLQQQVGRSAWCGLATLMQF